MTDALGPMTMSGAEGETSVLDDVFRPVRDDGYHAVVGARPLLRGVSPSLAADLARAIEQRIVPRLVQAHRGPGRDLERRKVSAHHEIWPAQVETLTSRLLACDADGARGCVESTRHAGVSLERIYLDLLGPVARRLGQLWEEDRCDFTQVTVGVWQLRQILRDLTPDFVGSAAAATPPRRALLMAVPGEQHTFGVVMVADFFRRAGWLVRSGPVARKRNCLA